MPKQPARKPDPSRSLSEAARAATKSLESIKVSANQARGTNAGQLEALRPFLEVIWEKIDTGMTRKTIHAAYKKQGFKMSYSAFARFVAENRPPKDSASSKP